MTGPTVTVDDAAIDALSKKFSDWAETVLGPAIKSLDGISVTPGEFEDATTLKTTVTTRAGELRTALTNIQLALTAISTNLQTVATNYRAAEDDSVVAADAIKPMIDQITLTLPGFIKS